MVGGGGSPPTSNFDAEASPSPELLKSKNGEGGPPTTNFDAEAGPSPDLLKSKNWGEGGGGG